MMKLLKNLFDNLGYIILIAFFVSNFPMFRKIMQKDKFNKKELAILSLIFGGFGILGTYAGTEINGAIANTRLIGIMSGGILCGPFVGIPASLIAGIHRLLMPSGRLTAVPCAIATIVSGVFSSYIYKKSNNNNRWLYGLFGGVIMESIEMLLILLIAKPQYQAIKIIKDIYLPMGLTNGIGIAILIVLIQNVFDEKEEIAAKQAQLALEIANKTLPYFRDVNSDSLKKICEIIKDSIKADAVSITDKKKILAHVGAGSDHHIAGQELLTSSTQRVIKEGTILTLSNSREINCKHENCPLKSAIIVPLLEDNEVIGALKIYFTREDSVSFSNRNLAVGLSQLISTQLEISKVGKLKELATKSEIRALQAQINPHFLFNTLNAISSFIRIDPNKARELIINFSTYLRYNIESGDELVSINKELEHVKAYVEIEKARFGDKLNVIYDIEDNIDVLIPPLIIQPLVENSIKHGILEGLGYGTVRISIKKNDEENLLISVEDDGIGFNQEIIEMVKKGIMKENKIGLTNVHNRLICIYGRGLRIENLEKGSKVSFVVPLR